MGPDLACSYPAPQQSTRPMIDMPEETRNDTMNRHVLIIDDNPSIHEDFKRILDQEQDEAGEALDAAAALLFEEDEGTNGTDEVVTEESFELKHAMGGKEGLALVEKHLETANPISVAFVDMRMPPGWNGLETIERLWASDPRLQIVICSAYSDVSWDTIRRQFGQRDNLLILRKPFEPEEVQQIASSLTQKWDLETNGKTIYTVAPEYPLRLVEVKPKKVTAKALICDGYVSLPNGENRKVFRKDSSDAPTTPTRALTQFVESQENVVEELSEKLAMESGKLDQARTLLASMQRDEVSSLEDLANP